MLSKQQAEQVLFGNVIKSNAHLPNTSESAHPSARARILELLDQRKNGELKSPVVRRKRRI